MDVMHMIHYCTELDLEFFLPFNNLIYRELKIQNQINQLRFCVLECSHFS